MKYIYQLAATDQNWKKGSTEDQTFSNWKTAFRRDWHIAGVAATKGKRIQDLLDRLGVSRSFLLLDISWHNQFTKLRGEEYNLFIDAINADPELRSLINLKTREFEASIYGISDQIGHNLLVRDQSAKTLLPHLEWIRDTLMNAIIANDLFIESSQWDTLTEAHELINSSKEIQFNDFSVLISLANLNCDSYFRCSNHI